MTWDDHFDSDFIGEYGGLLAPEITRDTSLWGATVDRKQCKVDIEMAQLIQKTFVRNRITRVIDGPWTKPNDVPEIRTLDKEVKGRIDTESSSTSKVKL